MAEKEKKSKFEEVLDTYQTESSIEGTQRRNDMMQEMNDLIDMSVRQFLIKKNGEGKKKGLPKSYKIAGHDDAHELVLEIGKSVLEHKFPKLNADAIKELMKDEGFVLGVIDDAVGHKGYGHQLAATFAELNGNVTGSDEYKDIRKRVSGNVANQKYLHAKTYLTHNAEKRGDIEKIVNKALGEHGKVVRATVNQGQLVEHLGNVYHEGGKLNKSYVEDAYAKHFKAAPKEKK
jgi:hypothetical protein